MLYTVPTIYSAPFILVHMYMILSYSKHMYLDLILGFNTFNYHYTIVNQPSVLHSSAFILTVSIDTYVYPYAGYGGGVTSP